MPLWLRSLAGFWRLVNVRHVGALGIWGGKWIWRPETWTRLMTQGGVEELAPVEDAEGEAIDLDEGIGHVEVVGIELEAGAG